MEDVYAFYHPSVPFWLPPMKLKTLFFWRAWFGAAETLFRSYRKVVVEEIVRRVQRSQLNYDKCWSYAMIGFKAAMSEETYARNRTQNSLSTGLSGSELIFQEKQDIKTFLSVMGLQTSMFYLSHVSFSWMKAAFVIIICTMPLAWAIEEVNAGILLITFLFYGLGSVSFAILCTAPFESPNRALKVIMLMWTISAGVGNFVVPALDDLLYCFLAALNINHAFKLALNVMAQFMRRGRFCGVLCARPRYCFIMMMVDVFLMLALTVLIDQCVENSDWSFWSMFRKDNNNADAVDNAESCGDHKTVRGSQGTVSDIVIENVIKVWSATGEGAVDGLNLKAYRGQVAVLLGHNEAGKSTTFSMVAGLVKPTSGKIMICEENASNCSDRSTIGYCPQGNVLFDRMTVDEHLWFIHGLKDVGGDYSVEAAQLIWELKLLPKQDELSMNLSGGMKRKLCVCMALIGGSRVVLLDEPTAGMDPGSPYHVEQLMARIKGDRFSDSSAQLESMQEVNGAGKTTAFDILTGRAFPTFGSATLDGRDAIGYCPQFDAMMMDFTGREILNMLARLHGFINFKEKGDIVLRAVGMEAQGNKLIKYYSGGQRRKISVGIALLSVTKMIILDEPTAGIDPKARRHIWNVLLIVREKSDSAQLLTSHSMDECEALCSRIAVLNKGSMIAIGTSQWLKSKFGNKFTLTIVAATVETRDHIIRCIVYNARPNQVQNDKFQKYLKLTRG